MNILRTTSRKIVLGAITASVAALSLTTALPASADSYAAIVTGYGSTANGAIADAKERCIKSGGSNLPIGGSPHYENGSHTYQLYCRYER